ILESLPVELLYEVQLHALSVALPITSRRLHDIFSAAPPSYCAEYLLGHIDGPKRLDDAVSRILRFPLCSPPVLDVVLHPPKPETEPEPPPPRRGPELPKHIFRVLGPRKEGEADYSTEDAPMPLLRCLYGAAPRLMQPDANSHNGYALTRAVHAGFVPLVRLLLEQGASPARKGGLAVLVAIRQKNLGLVRLLIERSDGAQSRGKNKRRKLEDRMEVTPDLLKAAVKAKARDIVDYFTQEKGCVPDMQTLQMLMR
ncbi:hypothetical protein FB45DRAFT_731527, partial [Roridomyces roridus]